MFNFLNITIRLVDRHFWEFLALGFSITLHSFPWSYISIVISYNKNWLSMYGSILLHLDVCFAIVSWIRCKSTPISCLKEKILLVFVSANCNIICLFKDVPYSYRIEYQRKKFAASKSFFFVEILIIWLLNLFTVVSVATLSFLFF